MNKPAKIWKSDDIEPRQIPNIAAIPEHNSADIILCDFKNNAGMPDFCYDLVRQQQDQAQMTLSAHQGIHSNAERLCFWFCESDSYPEPDFDALLHIGESEHSGLLAHDIQRIWQCLRRFAL